MKNMIFFAVKVIGGIFLAVFLLVIVLQFVLSIGIKRLVCTADEGSITIIYNKDNITGYDADNIEYDLEEQQQYASEVGVDAYMKEFSEWFQSNTTGSCKK